MTLPTKPPSVFGFTTPAAPSSSMPFYSGATYLNRGVSYEKIAEGDNLTTTVTASGTSGFTTQMLPANVPIAGYDTTVNTASDNQTHQFWNMVANRASQQVLSSIYVTSTGTSAQAGGGASNNFDMTIWGALLLKLSDYRNVREPEQNDIINVVENSLSAQDSESYITPTNLLRACAVGATVSAAIPERPHIYAAPGGRIVLDFAVRDDRLTAVVTDEYVHLLGDIHGQRHDLTMTNEKYDLLELKNWSRAL